MFQETYVDETVTSGLGSDQGTTPAATLTSQYSLPLVLLGTVGTKEPSNLTTRNTNVTSWDISIGTNVSVQLAHESHTELSDLIVRLALRVEVRTTLTTTNVDYSQLARVLRIKPLTILSMWREK